MKSIEKKDDLGNRMKSYYEDRYRISLPRKTNIILRIDGKAFHTYTKGLNRPFDTGFQADMNETTKFLCENIQGAKFGYVQSDEISLLVTDYDTINTDGWFDYNLQKMCSVSASMATAKFNQLRTLRFIKQKLDEGTEKITDLWIENLSTKNKLAMFDSRAFVIPSSEEVVNYFIWRQQDATRNSVFSAAQSIFSHSMLHGKNSANMQDMMISKGINWNDYPSRFKRGGSVIRFTTYWKRQKGSKSAGEQIDFSPSLVSDYGHIELYVAVLKETPDGKLLDIYERSIWKNVETPIFTQDRDFLKIFLK